MGSPPLNFRRSRVDPCLWTNSEGVRIGRHMDDFIKTDPPVAVEAVTEYLERVAQLKVTGVLDKFGKQARFLGSFITKVHGGYTIQTDTETLLVGLRDLNLEHCKPSKLPGANPRTHDLTPLEPSEHKLYRRVVGRFLYCSAHRGDFAFSLNQLCRRVQSPTVSDMQALRKLARYIKGTLHYKLNIRPRHNTDLKIEAYTDADWAGQSDRHSITGGLLMLDGVNVSSWARTQKAIATSSGESELYAMSVGAEALGLRELLTDIGLPTTVRLRCDSTAAMGTASRQGLGRMKHVQVRDLALQQWIADGRLTLQKIASSGNAADPSHETCVPECAPVSRPETWSSTITPRQTRLLECSVDKWKERHTCVLICGQMEGTVHLCCFWLDLAVMGMRLLSACAVKGTFGVPCSLQRNLLSVVCC